jgi:Domain of unknown function (DUF6894)
LPRYFFNVQGPGQGGVGDDLDGIELPSDDSAQQYARQIIHALRNGGGYSEVGLMLVVKSDAGATIFAIAFN